MSTFPHDPGAQKGIIAVLIGLATDSDRFDFETDGRGPAPDGWILEDVLVSSLMDDPAANQTSLGRESSIECFTKTADASTSGLMGDVPWKDGPFASLADEGLL